MDQLRDLDYIFLCLLHLHHLYHQITALEKSWDRTEYGYTLILVSSLFLRGVSYFSQQSDFDFVQYALPISFVGIISVTLLNLRATLILSLSSSLLALAGGGNIGLVALGALGTIIPAIFLSEDTDRALLRERIIYISLTQPERLEREFDLDLSHYLSNITLVKI